MARSPTKQSQKVELNTFVKGLVTEASPLNFPPNASVDEINFELNRDGTRDRRRGMDLETPFNYRGTGVLVASFESVGINSYVWTAVSGDVEVEYVVVQVENKLYLYDTQKDSISFDGYINSIVIAEYPTSIKYSFTSVDGNLIVASGVDTICVVSCNLPYALSYKLLRLKTRDVWGIEIAGTGADDNYETIPNYRGGPFTIPEAQVYNLQNQSWGIARKNKVITLIDPFGISSILRDPISYFSSELGASPSNYETVYAGLQFQASSGNDIPSERMYNNLYDEVRGAGVQASKGYFIIDLLRRGSSRIEKSAQNKAIYPQIDRYLTYGKQDYTPGGAKIVRAFAGRVFYSGFDGAVIDGDARSPSLENVVCFSQLIRNTQDINKCYQEGDPTSREANDIVDTDGGFIKVSQAERIVGMRALGANLIIFATNGVWELSGGSDYGFTATNYKITRLSSIGAYSESSIVEEVGKVFYWAKDGIYVVSKDQFGASGVQNLTQSTIQKLYDNIPNLAKEGAIGVYDLYSKKVRWLYNVGVPFTSTSQSFELILDITLGAFYQYKIGEVVANKIETVGLFLGAPFREGSSLEEIVVGSDEVFAGADLVVIDQTNRTGGLQSVKYLCMHKNNAEQMDITFSSYVNPDFIDWEKVDGVGVDAEAYVLTGAQIAGDSSVDKQIPYMTMHMRRTENGYDGEGNLLNQSSCLMRSQWDFSNTINSRRWSPLQQVYRYNTPHLITNDTYDSGFEVITTKNKMRGKGEAFSLYLQTEPKKDCRILGWNLAVNGNAVT